MNDNINIEELQNQIVKAVERDLEEPQGKKKKEALSKKQLKKEAKKEQKRKEKEHQEKLQKMYDMVMDYENMVHERNQKRIKIGLRCIFIIPAIFLFLMFTTGSSKVIFLVFWIVSLFVIAVYLIYVEYIDYNLQQKMNEIDGERDAQVDSLIVLPEQVEERMSHVMELMEEDVFEEEGEDDNEEYR